MRTRWKHQNRVQENVTAFFRIGAVGLLDKTGRVVLGGRELEKGTQRETSKYMSVLTYDDGEQEEEKEEEECTWMHLILSPALYSQSWVMNIGVKFHPCSD